MRRLAVAVLTGLLSVGACADDTGSDLDDYAAALGRGLQSEEPGTAIDMDDDEARCVGDDAAMVVGLEPLERIGTPEEIEEIASDDLAALDLDPAESDDVASAVFECVDDIADQIIASFELDGPTADACLAETLGRDELVQLLAVNLRGVDEVTEPPIAALLADIETALQTCA